MNVPESQARFQFRQPLPDQLRGLALLGIVFVNMPYLALSHAGLSGDSIRSAVDGVIAFLIVAFAQGKFYLLFSFLFGYSLTLMLKTRQGKGLAQYRRRLVGLAILGLLHAVLFFIGDILLSYALLGLALLWFAVRRTRTALRGAMWAYGVGVLIFAAALLAALGQPETGGGFVDNPTALDRAVQGGFIVASAARWDALPTVLTTLAVLNWAFALGMFLLGLVAGRLGVLAHPERYERLWTALLRWGLSIGVPCGLLSAWLVLFSGDRFPSLLGVALGFVTAPALTGAYVALAARFRHARALRFAAPAGRMSLSGYLGESILLSVLFSGWGLGLYGQVSLTLTALMTFGVWLTLDLSATLWLRFFQYGPFEWLLRCWTLGRITPLRNSSKASPARSSAAPGDLLPKGRQE